VQEWAWARLRRNATFRQMLQATGLVLLCLFAAMAVAKGVYYALQYSQDFQWSPAVLFAKGDDPFAWYLAGNADGRIIMSQEPNYLHLLYEMLVPFALMSWLAAKAAWALCNLAMAVACAYILSRDAGLRSAAQAAVIAVFLTASPFVHTLGNGQQSLLCLFALTLAWRGQARGTGGIGLAVGAVKYSIALPIGLWLLLQRRFSALGVASLVSLLALALFVCVTRAHLREALIEPLHVGASATHVGLADAMSFVRSLDLDPSLANTTAYLAGLGAAGFGMATLWRARQRLDEADLFALLCVISLFAFFHNLYDYVLLLPLFCRAFCWSIWPRAIAFGYVGYFWFIVSFIEPWLKSSAAIGLMALGSATVFALIVWLVSERVASASSPPVISTSAHSRPATQCQRASPPVIAS
jgi:hypothetical protein